MDEKEKLQVIKKLKRSENGNTATSDDDLEKSCLLKNKNQAFKDNYKEFYDDVKLHIKEDW
ncbi:MAG: hypothetical protein RR357_06050 [Clostridia bacterium]